MLAARARRILSAAAARIDPYRRTPVHDQGVGPMPGLVPPVADEREALLGYLAQQRHVLRIAASGLTDQQARATPTASALRGGGVVQHLVRVDRRRLHRLLAR